MAAILRLQELLRPLALVPVRTKLCASEHPALLPIVLPTLRAGARLEHIRRFQKEIPVQTLEAGL